MVLGRREDGRECESKKVGRNTYHDSVREEVEIKSSRRVEG